MDQEARNQTNTRELGIEPTSEEIMQIDRDGEKEGIAPQGKTQEEPDQHMQNVVLGKDQDSKEMRIDDTQREQRRENKKNRRKWLKIKRVVIEDRRIPVIEIFLNK